MSQFALPFTEPPAAWGSGLSRWATCDPDLTSRRRDRGAGASAAGARCRSNRRRRADRRAAERQVGSAGRCGDRFFRARRRASDRRRVCRTNDSAGRGHDRFERRSSSKCSTRPAQKFRLLWSPNMSLAVNLTMKLAQVAATALAHHPSGADVEIIESPSSLQGRRPQRHGLEIRRDHRRAPWAKPNIATAAKAGPATARTARSAITPSAAGDDPGPSTRSSSACWAKRSSYRPRHATAIATPTAPWPPRNSWPANRRHCTAWPTCCSCNSQRCSRLTTLRLRYSELRNSACVILSTFVTSTFVIFSLMAKCEEGYLCDVCGGDVEDITDSDLYLRYVIGQVDPETLHTTRERHIRCNPVLAQFIVADDFEPVVGRRPIRQTATRPAHVPRARNARHPRLAAPARTSRPGPADPRLSAARSPAPISSSVPSASWQFRAIKMKTEKCQEPFLIRTNPLVHLKRRHQSTELSTSSKGGCPMNSRSFMYF